MTTAHEHNTSPFPPANRKRSSPTMRADFLRHLAYDAWPGRMRDTVHTETRLRAGSLRQPQARVGRQGVF